MKAFSKKRSGAISALEMKKPSVKLAYWIVFALLIIATIVCLFPPLWILMSAFKDTQEFLAVPPTLFPHSFHPEKIKILLEKTNFFDACFNSVIMTLGDVLSSLLFNGLAGYVISRLKPKGSTLIATMILWTMMMPTSVATVPLFMTFVDFPGLHINLLDTYFPMWMISGANAFNVLLFKNFFDSISKSYIEAARIDGCSNVGIFTRIILPMSKPIVVTVAIFTFNGAWGSFFWPYLVLKDSSKMVVGLQIFKMKESVSVDLYVMALLFAIIPPSLVFMFLQKHIMDGVSLGGVKG